MINLLLAILSSAMVSVVMRISGNKVSANVSMLATNYLMCLTLAGAYMGFGNIFPNADGLGQTIGFGLLNGILYPLGFILLQLNVKRNGVVLSSTFMKLGLLVPMVISVCFFAEIPTLVQILGFCIAVAAILMINFDPAQTAMKFKMGLILLLLAGGSSDAMSKVFEELGNAAFSEQFLFYTFAVAFILCIGLIFYKKERPGKVEFFFGLLIGIPNYFSARFLLKSLDSIAAVIVYPVYSVATILLVTLIGTCFFKERLGRLQWIALAAILLALVLLNI